MAKKRKRRVKKGGQGGVCISTAKPRPGGGRFVIQVTCYKTQQAADTAFKSRRKGAYNAMMFRRRGKVG